MTARPTPHLPAIASRPAPLIPLPVAPLPAVPPPVVDVDEEAEVPFDTELAEPLSWANPTAAGLYRKEVYTFLRKLAPTIHDMGDCEPLQDISLVKYQNGDVHLQIHFEESPGAHRLVVGERAKVHIRIRHCIAEPAKLQRHRDRSITGILVVPLVTG